MKLSTPTCATRALLIALTFVTALIHAQGELAHANPYLAKPAEPVVKARVGTCAVTGGFVHLYTALDNRLFDKYGINVEHVVLRGGGVGHGCAGVGRNPIPLLQRGY